VEYTAKTLLPRQPARYHFTDEPGSPSAIPFEVAACGWGLPTRPVVWIENGVVKNLNYDRYWAQKQGKERRVRVWRRRAQDVGRDGDAGVAVRRLSAWVTGDPVLVHPRGGSADDHVPGLHAGRYVPSLRSSC
jgi:hypothetical protein